MRFLKRHSDEPLMEAVRTDGGASVRTPRLLNSDDSSRSSQRRATFSFGDIPPQRTLSEYNVILRTQHESTAIYLLDGAIDAGHRVCFEAEDVPDIDDSNGEDDDEEANETEDDDEPQVRMVSMYSQKKTSPTRADAFLVLGIVVLGCACEASGEWIFSRDQGCGDLAMLAEYIHSLIVAGPRAERARRASGGNWAIPLRYHSALAASGVLYGLLVNGAYASPLPNCVILVLKNGILVQNLIIGRVLGRSYSFGQVLSVCTVSSGLVLTALGGQPPTGTASASGSKRAALGGLVLMLGSLVSRGVGNAFQEVAMRHAAPENGGAPVAEAMLFRSLLGLPLLAFQRRSILKHGRRWNQKRLAGVRWPGMWAMLLVNLFLNYYMRAGVTSLVGRTSALTANVVLSIQRFVSFAISALVLNPIHGGTPPSVWIGGLIALSGTVTYAQATAAATRNSRTISLPKQIDSDARSGEPRT